jgi:WD40 repeat protein/serine/threonine protein kinase
MSASSPDNDELLDRLAEEFADRYRRGERPALKEYTEKFPELANEIRELFPALVEMEQVEEDREEALGQGGPAKMAPPHQVGDYQLVRKVGRGGMGVVYEAEQISLGRRVALKILPQSAPRDGHALERFKREARAAARLHHTNIVPVFEVGQDGATWYYAMQFIQGQSLDEVIEELCRLRTASRANEDREGGNREGGAPGGPFLSLARPEPRPPGPSSSVNKIAQSLLTGQFNPQDPEVAAPPPSQAAAPEAPAEQIVDPGPPPGLGAADSNRTELGVSSSAVLPGQQQLSSVHSDHQHYFVSVARIGQQVAQALAYAHARGIVHRDIKPSNLLLDTAGVVWVTDFGLAKTEDDGITGTGDLVGTLRYMAPERFRGECDVRADVYALGLTLYEMLTLRPAFVASDRLRLIELVRRQDPVRPRSVDRRIPRDLETIVLKAIDKDLRRRYQSADDLAEDLRRFLADEPIRARRTSGVERSFRWCRRNPTVAALLAAVAALLLAGAGVASFFAVRAEDQARQANANALAARANEDQARQEKRAAEAARREAEGARSTALKARDEADAARRELQQNLYYAEMNFAGQAAEAVGGIRRVAELLAHWRPTGTEPDRRGWEWYYLRGLGERATHTLSLHAGPVQAVRWSPDGQRLASAGKDSTVVLWDAATGREVATLRGHAGPVQAVSWSPDGRRLASAGHDKTVRVWDAPTGREIFRLYGHTAPVQGVCWSPDGQRLASTGLDLTIRFWDGATGRPTACIARAHDGSWPLAVSWSPDGKHLASTSWNPIFKIWDAATGREVARLSGHKNGVLAVSWSPDSKRLASASWDQTVRVWDAATAREVLARLRHVAWVRAVHWSPDGKRLASAGGDGAVKVWDALTGRETETLAGHTGEVLAVNWNRASNRLASAGDDGTIKLWDAALRQPPALGQGYGNQVFGVAWSPNGGRLAVVAKDLTIKVWDVNTGRERAALRGHTDWINGVAWSPDGRLASTGLDQTIRIWDVNKGKEIVTLRGQRMQRFFAVAWSPDGRRLAGAGWDPAIEIWDVRTWRRTATLRGHTSNRIFAVHWSPDGRRLASACDDYTARVWDAATGKEVLTLSGHRGEVWDVVWSPDGRRLATASWDQTLKTWNAATGKEIATLRGHSGVVMSASWNIDSRRLASASQDRTVKVWDAGTGKEVLTLRGHANGVSAVSWSPDGLRLASAGKDQTLKVWDATRGYTVERSPRLLPLLDQRVRDRPHGIPDLLLGAEIRARLGQWQEAGADVLRAAKDGRAPAYFVAGWWSVKSYPPDTPGTKQTTSKSSPDPFPEGPHVAPDCVPVWYAPGQDPNGLVPLPAEKTSYLLTRVFASQGQEAALRLGPPPWPRLWLNGKEVYPRSPAAKGTTEPDALLVYLRARWNTLALQWTGGPPAEGFHVRLTRDPVPLARVFAQAGRWDRAVDTLTRAITHEPETHLLWYQAAPLFLQAGDSEGYRRHCRQMLQRFGKTQDPVLAERTAKACLLLPPAKQQLKQASDLAERALRQGSRHWARPYLELAQGLAEYRQGSFSAAGKRLGKLLADGKGDWDLTVPALLVLAMTHRQQGQLVQARTALDRATQVLGRKIPRLTNAGDNWHDGLICQVLRREAEELLDGTIPKPNR